MEAMKCKAATRLSLCGANLAEACRCAIRTSTCPTRIRGRDVREKERVGEGSRREEGRKQRAKRVEG
eukprot:3222257-Rhodomonas_salina.1